MSSDVLLKFEWDEAEELYGAINQALPSLEKHRDSVVAGKNIYKKLVIELHGILIKLEKALD